MIKVSVTVPIYNPGQYFRKCLESLSAQTLKEIEFILVDDGSTDGSGDICEEYASMDSRFKVIHKENGGSASARQAGLDASLGEYIIVCDSDDWVEPDIYEKLYNKAIECGADMVVCDYWSEYSNGQTVSNYANIAEKNGIVYNIDFMQKAPGRSWSKLVRKSLYTDTNATYEPGINLGEDALITYKLLKGDPKIVYLHECLYHYRRIIGGESYTNNLKMESVKQSIHIYYWLCENYPDSKYEAIRFNRALDIAFSFLRVKDLDKSICKDFLYMELPLKQFFKNKKSLKSLVVFVEKAISFDLAKNIVKRLYKYFYK